MNRGHYRKWIESEGRKREYSTHGRTHSKGTMRRGLTSSSPQQSKHVKWSIGCGGFRTWMFFCCETLVMVVITTLAVLYIAHFTGKLAEGGAEVAQQREYHYHRRGMSKNHDSNINQHPHGREEGISPHSGSEPKWKRQLDYIADRFNEYLSTHEEISNRLENVRLGKILAADAQTGAWSNVLYLRINLELENVDTLTSKDPTTAADDPTHRSDSLRTTAVGRVSFNSRNEILKERNLRRTDDSVEDHSTKNPK